ncbi:RICIN domain-containing protein [Streptomyces sp. NPDC056401]|uniref:RICIN domain-containing protein n=1 Tax=Streptomyces sp. NPDC056401 TaxID=3345809 RepID=UPI0035DC75EA
MLSKRLGVLASALVTFAALMPMATASADGGVGTKSVINPPGHYGLANYNSNKCLAVLANGSHGSRATQTTCGNFDDQSWIVNPEGAITEIRNKYSGKCLTVQGTADGAPAFQYTCTGLKDQKWYAYHINSSYTWYVNYNSNKCLVVQGKEEGNAAFQFTCGYWEDQYWAW